ncbi:abscission/NoCut checkpoint regulator isoform X2 [Manis pentadactyla]|uniref:abscission/NoCut checkpoint regulator isoform X2 n=1 Tax=Manis pentadactyla TaxID=143292 RepID=UPI00255C8E17|nr:abscission/NoCut checkpoint regulator isoform X2 [Manis pentadactyla]
MESRCYSCAVKFTLFKKEYGCKNCGRAFCSGCLGFSAVVPQAGNTRQKVCKQCHEVLTRGSSSANASKWSPPQNYKKRVAAMETKQKLHTPQSQGQTRQDQVIAERLAQLRQENKPKSVPSQAEVEARLAALRDEPQSSIPSTQEMEARLAALQGKVLPSQNPQLAHRPPDTRTQAQQAQDLLTQMTAEVGEALLLPLWEANINQRTMNMLPLGRTASTRVAQGAGALIPRGTPPGLCKRRRAGCWLRQLSSCRKRTQGRSGSWPSPSAWLCSGDRTLIELTEEAALDEASGFNIPVEPTLQPQAQSCRAEPEALKAQATALKPEAEEEELPWCYICNEDATLRCAGCDGDLYCVCCFRESHDAFELQEHQTSAYSSPYAGQEH